MTWRPTIGLEQRAHSCPCRSSRFLDRTDGRVRQSARVLGAVSVAACVLVGCQRDVANEAETTSAPLVTTVPATTVPATTAPATTTPGTTVPQEVTTTGAAPDTTFAQVTSTVVGTAVAGNSGGVGAGQTNTFSEAVRNEDGTCSGWVGPGGQTWTEGLESGAPVTFLADDDSDDRQRADRHERLGRRRPERERAMELHVRVRGPAQRPARNVPNPGRRLAPVASTPRSS